MTQKPPNRYVPLFVHVIFPSSFALILSLSKFIPLCLLFLFSSSFFSFFLTLSSIPPKGTRWRDLLHTSLPYKSTKSPISSGYRTPASRQTIQPASTFCPRLHLPRRPLSTPQIHPPTLPISFPFLSFPLSSFLIIPVLELGERAETNSVSSFSLAI